MISALAPDLPGHEAAREAIGRHLEGCEAGAVEITGVGRLGMRTKPGRTARDPRTGDPVAVPPSRFVVFGTPDARDELLAPSPSLEALGAALAGALAEEGRAVHVPGIGTFARREGAAHFASASALRHLVNGAPLVPMDAAALEATLARFATEPFGVRELQELLAAARTAAEPEDDVLVDLPAGLPRLLRAALARSAELGNVDAFGFLTPMHRDWAYADFAKGRSDRTPDVFLLSDAEPRSAGRSGNVWALRLEDLGAEDPQVTWCRDHRALEEASGPPRRVRLSTFLRVAALETVLGPLDPGGAARVREAVVAACPDLAEIAWPTRWAFAAPDPWLGQVVLTW